VIHPTGLCRHCTRHWNAAPPSLGPEFAGFRACALDARLKFSGQATAHGFIFYSHPDAGCQDFDRRTRSPRPPRTSGASPSPQK
jgi:hypothetical protein